MDELRKALGLSEHNRRHAAQLQGRINELEHQITSGGHNPAVADQIAELRPQLEAVLRAVEASESDVARLRELGVPSTPRVSEDQPGAQPPPVRKPEARTPKVRPDPRKKHV